jgi:hypothetical protein
MASLKTKYIKEGSMISHEDYDSRHGCSYIHLFHENSDREDLYEIVRDFAEGRDFKHFMIKYVDEQDPLSPGINYKILFTPTIYNLRYLINEYMDHVKTLRTLRGLKTPLTEQEQKKLNKFFELNNWNDWFKNSIKNRRLYGDDYSYLRMRTFEDFGQIPIITKLEQENIVITRNPKDPLQKEYIYKIERDYPVRNPDRPLEVKYEKEEIQLVFTKGTTLPFVAGTLEASKSVLLPESIKDYNPVIHLQYLKSEYSEYSEIPALDFIDHILRLHRIETDIAETNSKSGSPQVWGIDVIVDPKSKFGARGIAYADTTQAALSKGKQGVLTQFEITNGLDSLYKEQDVVLNGLFSGANLISPSLKQLLAKSDSSKVIKYLSTDLIEELRLAYEEMSEKTKVIWKALFPDRKEENISLDIPTDLYSSSLLDKATYINGNVLTIREMLKEQGKSPEEIELFMNDLNQQIQLLSGNGLSVTPQLANPQIMQTLGLAKTDSEKINEKEENGKLPHTEQEGMQSDVSPMANPRAGR